MMSRQKFRAEIVRALHDAMTGLSLWPLWTRLGWYDILKRYRRSVLGPFWLTASMGIMIAVVCTENPIRIYRMIESAKLAR
jgi:hypothetical protein